MLDATEAQALMKAIGRAIGPRLREITDALRLVRARQASTDDVLADLDQRLEAIEARLAELDR